MTERFSMNTTKDIGMFTTPTIYRDSAGFDADTLDVFCVDLFLFCGDAGDTGRVLCNMLAYRVALARKRQINCSFFLSLMVSIPYELLKPIFDQVSNVFSFIGLTK